MFWVAPFSTEVIRCLGLLSTYPPIEQYTIYAFFWLFPLLLSVRRWTLSDDICCSLFAKFAVLCLPVNAMLYSSSNTYCRCIWECISTACIHMNELWCILRCHNCCRVDWKWIHWAQICCMCLPGYINACHKMPVFQEMHSFILYELQIWAKKQLLFHLTCATVHIVLACYLVHFIRFDVFLLLISATDLQEDCFLHLILS